MPIPFLVPLTFAPGRDSGCSYVVFCILIKIFNHYGLDDQHVANIVQAAAVSQKEQLHCLESSIPCSMCVIFCHIWRFGDAG